MSTSQLGIYLNDQLAAGVLWREVARRSARSNAGTPAGEALAAVAEEIAEDVETFGRIIDELGIRRSAVKPLAAAAAERLGRLKLNGRLLSYSPLSRFIELDFLVMGIEGKLTLWDNLSRAPGLASSVPWVDFEQLKTRARAQRERLEPHHRAAAECLAVG